MKKTCFIISIICFALCIACTVACICLSVSSDYAETHYTVTKKIVPLPESSSPSKNENGFYNYNFLREYTYGCGEFYCKYCNGQLAEDRGSSFSDYNYFVYYRTTSGFKTASLVGSIIFGVSSAVFFALSFKKTKKLV